MRRAVGAIATVVVVAGAGIAYASVPGSDGVLHGCYMTKGGTLRVVDSATPTCGKGEQAIQWNQSGPQGPAGPAGATGTAGAQGPAGPSTPPEAMIAGDPQADVLITSESGHPVLSIDLPAGSWSLLATGRAKAPDYDSLLMGTCSLGLAGVGLATTVFDLQGDLDNTSFTLLTIVTLPAPGSVELSCSAFNGDYHAKEATILATQVTPA